jgi:hypothetical protein
MTGGDESFVYPISLPIRNGYSLEPTNHNVAFPKGPVYEEMAIPMPANKNWAVLLESTSENMAVPEGLTHKSVAVTWSPPVTPRACPWFPGYTKTNMKVPESHK